MSNVSWELKGMEYGNCNCAYGCPCQFNALPTYGNCQYLLFARVDQSRYNYVNLDGVCFAMFGEYPEAVHLGNGTQQLVISDGTSDEQQEAIRRIVYNEDSEELKTHYAVYNAMSTTVHDPIIAPIELEIDMENRTARGHIPGWADSNAEPIRNPVTGEEHRATIGLPEGFEFTIAEVGSASSTVTGHIPLELKDSYAQFNELHMNQEGVIR